MIPLSYDMILPYDLVILSFYYIIIIYMWYLSNFSSHQIGLLSLVQKIYIYEMPSRFESLSAKSTSQWASSKKPFETFFRSTILENRLGIRTQ